MRASLLAFVFASLTTVAAADATPATKSKVGHVDPLPATKADAGVAGRAVLVKELPKTLSAADHKALDAVVADLRADRLESAASLFRVWALGAPKQLLHFEAVATALWVFREGILSRNSEMENAADHVRFCDERNAATDDTLAILKSAAITKKPVLVARMVVFAPYAKEIHGDEKRERQITRDQLDGEIKDLETKSDAIKKERDDARAAFAALGGKTGPWMQLLAALVKSADDMHIAGPSR